MLRRQLEKSRLRETVFLISTPKNRPGKRHASKIYLEEISKNLIST